MSSAAGSFSPDALHVGFSKCASTFLQAFFEEHPSVFLVNQSHYFAPFQFSDFPAGKEEYFRRFKGAQNGQVRLESDEHILMPLFHPVLEAAATTLDSVAEVSARIKSIQPDAKIIIVIRNQTDLIVSRYSEFILGGGKCDFDDFVSEFLQCSKDGVNYYQNYYAKIAQIFHTDFSADNVLVLLQEELARDERLTIERLSNFLDIEFRCPSRRGMISRRVGLSSVGIKVMRAINKVLVKRPKRSFNEAQVRIPFILYKVIQRALRIVDYYLPKAVKGDKNSILTDVAKARIVDEFKEDNKNLAELLCKDLTALGY